MDRKFICGIAALLCFSAGLLAQNGVQDAASKAAEALANAPEAEKQAAKPDYWTKFVKFDLGFTNTTLTNWAAGGLNQTAFNSAIDAQANYKKDLMYWNNRLQLDYGFLSSSDKPFLQKNKDRMYLDSKWGYKTSEKSKWSYTASFNFRSQFTSTHKFVTPSVTNPVRKDWFDVAVLQSDFLSPAYTDLSLGMDWQPKPWFNMNFSPLTGGFTIVTREELRPTYTMPLRKAYADYAADQITTAMYRSARFQFGAKLTMNAKFSINEVFTGETQLILFSDYLNNPAELRVNWDNKIAWNISKHFALALQTWLIYDPNVLIEGEKKVQFKEYLTLNFTHTLAPRK